MATSTLVCARCNEEVTFSGTADDGSPMYEDRGGVYVCALRHGHDADGVFAPNHDADASRTQHDDDQYFIVFDQHDACYFDDDSDTWVVPNNPFTP